MLAHLDDWLVLAAELTLLRSRLMLPTTADAASARGAPESQRSAGLGRIGVITALLRACLVVLAVPEDLATAFRVALPFWSVADALARMRRMLAAMGEKEVGLEAFLPNVPVHAGNRQRRCRAAVASTFVGGRELAREGVVTLIQAGGFGPITVRNQSVVGGTQAAL